MTQEQLFSDLHGAANPGLTATRAAGLSLSNQFAARAGIQYARLRNYDFGPDRRSNISTLSPWIRHRLISEDEVLRATLARQSQSAAEKFVQEVFWRGYFKGWLEQHPTVWDTYQTGLYQAQCFLDVDTALASDIADATAGRTGIDCFDAWAKELVETGYLHNHARMWFASIWIFTLRLPWELGADFFLRHLIDGDPASNTLGWRWVGGLHTKGKTYLARASNIAKYTEGRFDPAGQLADSAPPLVETVEHPRRPIPASDAMPNADALLLITEEDCSAESWLSRDPAGVVGMLCTSDRAISEIGGPARTFAEHAVQDALDRAEKSARCCLWDTASAETVMAAAERAGTKTIVTAYAPIGPVASRLAALQQELTAAGFQLHQVRRRYDDLVWPHATAGYFRVKKRIPHILSDLGVSG